LAALEAWKSLVTASATLISDMYFAAAVAPLSPIMWKSMLFAALIALMTPAPCGPQASASEKRSEALPDACLKPTTSVLSRASTCLV
jgi:hypothetical protein